MKSAPEILEDHSTGGVRGVHDAGVRLEQMDREGITAELVYLGDFRTTDLAHNVTNGFYPFDMWDAGARAFDRWIFDAFGHAQDRLLLTGAIGSCVDMDSALSELRWIADHGFIGTFTPGFMRHADMPPLYSEYWEPFWAECEARGVALVVHAGYGGDQGVTYTEMERIYREVKDAGGSEMDLVMKLATDLFTSSFFSDPKPRRAMWQLMLSGVFDRHPDLKLVMTEVRVDWLPATLQYLDKTYENLRDDLPARRRPSEYWHDNCIAGASFIHKAEVEMRHEIGVETVMFGRDYPHPEGTWPNTGEWLRDAFAGVDERELRLMLGENAIRFLGLDRDALTAIAERIGPTVASVIGEGPAVDTDLIGLFDQRGGYMKAAEGADRLPEVEPVVRGDLVGMGVRGA
jgi:predicted TIM-barrel fold metal-dependent hydrolase